MSLSAKSLKVKVFGDGADREGILQLYRDPLIAGFTTNPTLMRKAGISDYEAFAKDILSVVKDRPISFEVFSDDLPEMEAQALELASWGENVYVKIPITNSKGELCAGLIARLAQRGVKVNVTALMTPAQVRLVARGLGDGPPACVSVFAGRVADTGVDPVPVMKASLDEIARWPNIELIWASPREVFNIVQANAIGCHIITVTHDLLKKLPMLGKDLDELSLETVQMFRRDAVAAGFSLDVGAPHRKSASVA